MMTGRIKYVMVYPYKTDFAPLPPGAGETVRTLYGEAGSIAARSPRAANALLRAALEVLCKQVLADDAKNMTLSQLIKQVDEKYKFDLLATKSMNNIRATGNEAIHPGQIELQETTDPQILSRLLSYIVKQCISQHLHAEKSNQLVEDAKDGKDEQQPAGDIE